MNRDQKRFTISVTPELAEKIAFGNAQRFFRENR